MHSKRVTFTMRFEVDLDPVGGPWNEPQDWINHITWHFVDTKSPYRPKAEVISAPAEIP